MILGSWLEKMKVVSIDSLMWRIRSMMFRPVVESRLAVGSSARTICGSVTSARAIATRWRWPPLRGLVDLLDHLLDALFALLLAEFALQEQRKLDVVKHVEHVDQVEALEDKPQLVQPQRGQLLVGQLRGRLPVDEHLAAGGDVDAPHQVEHRGLAAARRAGDRGEFAAFDSQIDPLEGSYDRVPQRVVFVDVSKLDDGCHKPASPKKYRSNLDARGLRSGAAPLE